MTNSKKDQYKQLIELFPEPILVHIYGEIVYVNMFAMKILGASTKEQLIGKSIIEIVHPDDREKVISAINAALENPYEYGIEGENRYIEERLLKLDGGIVHVEATGIAFEFEGKAAILTIGKDITKQKQHEETIKKLAYSDFLTGLPNRRWFIDIFSKQLQKQSRFAVLFLDVDGFKQVNDQFGHTGGDMLLSLVAQRLKDSVGVNDVVCRYAGDEFVIVLPNINTQREIEKVSRKIISSFEKPMSIEEKAISISASIGIAVYPFDGENPDLVVKHADTAMFDAKAKGKNQYRFYNQIRI